MRAGRLDTPVDVLRLTADLEPQLLKWVWAGVRSKDAADVTEAAGIRASALIEVRAWFDDCLVQGRYLRAGERLLMITSARDFSGDRSELVMSAIEFVGEPACVLPVTGAPRKCRAFINHESMHRDEYGQATGYKSRAEVALIEAGRVQVDDRLQVAGVTYLVIDIDKESDDGVVRGLWLDRVG